MQKQQILMLKAEENSGTVSRNLIKSVQDAVYIRSMHYAIKRPKKRGTKKLKLTSKTYYFVFLRVDTLTVFLFRLFKQGHFSDVVSKNNSVFV